MGWGSTGEGNAMPMWGGTWSGPWSGMGWFMPLFWVLVIAVVIAFVVRRAGEREGNVSQELAALRRDVQDLKDEVRKLRAERQGAGSASG